MAIPDNYLPTSIPRAERMLSEHVITLPRGALVEYATDPGLFVHIGRKVALNDVVTVLAEDGSFDVELRVIQIDPAFLWVKTRVLRMWPEARKEAADVDADKTQPSQPPRPRRPPPGTTAPDEDGYTIGWAGPHDKFRIVNTVAGVTVQKGFATSAEAVEALSQIKQAQAA